jgi:hypothetical protein
MLIAVMSGLGALVLIFVLYDELNQGIPGYVGNKPEKNVVMV